MGENLLAKALIAKLNKSTEFQVTELTSSTADEQALAIMNRQRSRVITIVSSRRKFLFDIQVDPYWLKWQTKHSKLAAKNFETYEFHQNMWNCYLRLVFVWWYNPWNTISNDELQLSYRTLRSYFVLPSATTLSNICWMEFPLSLEPIQKQLPSRNRVTLALDRLSSAN